MLKALRGLGKSSQNDQNAIAVALKAKAYKYPTVGEGIWNVLSDPEWRNSVLGTVDNTVFDLLMEAFSLLQIDNNEEKFSSLPHNIAEFCENADGKERRRYLFFYFYNMFALVLPIRCANSLPCLKEIEETGKFLLFVLDKVSLKIKLALFPFHRCNYNNSELKVMVRIRSCCFVHMVSPALEFRRGMLAGSAVSHSER